MLPQSFSLWYNMIVFAPLNGFLNYKIPSLAPNASSALSERDHRQNVLLASFNESSRHLRQQG